MNILWIREDKRDDAVVDRQGTKVPALELECHREPCVKGKTRRPCKFFHRVEVEDGRVVITCDLDPVLEAE